MKAIFQDDWLNRVQKEVFHLIYADSREIRAVHSFLARAKRRVNFEKHDAFAIWVADGSIRRKITRSTSVIYPSQGLAAGQTVSSVA